MTEKRFYTESAEVTEDTETRSNNRSEARQTTAFKDLRLTKRLCSASSYY